MCEPLSLKKCSKYCSYTPGKIDFQLLGYRYGVGGGTLYYLILPPVAMSGAGGGREDRPREAGGL
jgi:hypothetical protein